MLWFKFRMIQENPFMLSLSKHSPFFFNFIPAWIAGTQAHMDVFGGIVPTGRTLASG